MTAERESQISEARLFLRWAADALNETERAAVEDYALERPDAETAEKLGITRGGVWMGRKSGLAKLKKRLEAAGIRRMEDLIR